MPRLTFIFALCFAVRFASTCSAAHVRRRKKNIIVFLKFRFIVRENTDIMPVCDARWLCVNFCGEVHFRSSRGSLLFLAKKCWEKQCSSFWQKNQRFTLKTGNNLRRAVRVVHPFFFSRCSSLQPPNAAPSCACWCTADPSHSQPIADRLAANCSSVLLWKKFHVVMCDLNVWVHLCNSLLCPLQKKSYNSAVCLPRPRSP